MGKKTLFNVIRESKKAEADDSAMQEDQEGPEEAKDDFAAEQEPEDDAQDDPNL